MSFADDLNSKVNLYNQAANNNILTQKEFISKRIIQYTSDLKALCTKQAEQGQRNLIGFFEPQTIDNNYETTVEGPAVLSISKNLINKKPTKNVKYPGLLIGSGNTVLYGADLSKLRGMPLDKKITFSIDATMIENVRTGIIRSLSNLGFKRVNIEHLTGNRYELKKVLLSEVISISGTNHYFYVDIAW